MTQENRLLCILPTGEWCFIDCVKDIEFYRISHNASEGIMNGSIWPEWGDDLQKAGADPLDLTSMALQSLKDLKREFASATNAGGKIEGDDATIAAAQQAIALLEGRQ